jgi:hypothetical protein
LEHSYLVKEENWDSLSQFFKDNKSYKPVLSDWTIVEISQASDLSQAKRRIAFVESLSPLWLVNKLKVQKQELRSFLYRFYWGLPISPYSAFTADFADVSEEVIPIELKGDWTFKSFVLSCIQKPSHLNEIHNSKDLYIDNYHKLKSIGFKKLQKRIDVIIQGWIEGILPEKTPDGGMVTDTEKKQLISFCLGNRAIFYKNCKYFSFEKELFFVRLNDMSRAPKKSDAIDLEHICCSAPYCDFVVTEKYLKHIGSIAGKKVSMAKIVTDISEIV